MRSTDAEGSETRAEPAARAYVVPFATLIVLLGVANVLKLDPRWAYPLRSLAALAALLVFSRRVVSLRAGHVAASVLLGAAVFLLWIGPDLVWPGYRSHWLFHNALIEGAGRSVPPQDRSSPLFLFFRIGGSALLVPIVEELFWRAWLMRRIISDKVEAVPLGAYSAASFWITALLFASEHGSYWDVGLLAGVAYNWWMVRTRNLGDCILAHAVTNACLAAYVLAAGRWEYWP